MPDSKRQRITAELIASLQKEREKQKLSLNQLAAKSGLSRQMVSYIEQGKRNPSLEVLLRLSDALNVHLDQLLLQARRAAEA